MSFSVTVAWPAWTDAGDPETLAHVRRGLRAARGDRLNEDLEDAAGRRVDLVDLAKAPPLLAHQVVSKGSCLVCRQPSERAAFETRTVLRYLDTAHLRNIQHEYLRKRAGAS